jgi:ABC-2 type transport system permease protein
MFHRLKTLVAMQLANRLAFSIKRNKGRVIAGIAVKVTLFFGLIFLIAILIPTFQGLTYITVNTTLLQAILFFTQIFAIIACTIGLMNTLYTSKDNAILLALPARHSEIFVSKLIVYYYFEFRKNLLLLLPLFLGYGLHFRQLYGFDFAFIAKVFLMAVIIPLFPVLIGAVLSIPLVFIVNYLKRHPFLNALVVGILMFFAFLGISSLVSIITQKEHLRLDAFIEILRNGVKDGIPLFNKWSLFYGNINNFIFSGNQMGVLFGNLGIVLGVLAGLLALVFTLSIWTYFRLTAFTFEQAKTNRYHSQMKQSSNTYFTFLKKEIKSLFRSSDQLIAQFFSLLLLPFLLYILNLIFLSLKISPFGAKIVVGVNICIGLLLLTTANTTSATALTREGTEFYLLKTAPTNLKNITWAKLTINFAASILVILATMIALLKVHVFSSGIALMIGLVFLLFNSGHILWSYELDLLNPKFMEYANSQSIDDNPNATKSILIGTVLSLGVCAITIAMLFENVVTGWIRLILLAAAFFGIRLYMLLSKSKLYFNEIGEE